MSNWSSYQFTRKGEQLRAKVEAGKCKLTLTKIKIGNGHVTLGDIKDMNNLKSPQLVLGISSCAVSAEDDRVCEVVGIASSSSVENAFSVTEMGLYANDPDVGEILYLVEIDTSPDDMPNKNTQSPVTLTYKIELVTSNTANVTAMVSPAGLVTVKMMSAHRTAAELDHPDGSVTTPKIRDAAVTGAKIANKAIGKEHLKDGVVDDKAPIVSPALTGTPTVPTASKGTNTDQIASTAFVAQAVAALNGLDSMDKLAKEIEGKLGKQGIVAGNLETNGWVKFADGLIVQWGIVKEVHFDSTDIPVTFPIAFTKSCFVVIPTLHQPIATGGSITAFVKRGTITLQGCTCVADHSNERPTGDMFFLAIGI